MTWSRYRRDASPMVVRRHGPCDSAIRHADWAGYIRQSATVDIAALDPAYSSYASTSVFLGAGTPPYTLVKIFYNTEANKNRDVDGDAMLDSTTVMYLGDDGAGGLARNLTGTGTPILTIQSYVEDGDRRERVEAEIISAFVARPLVEAVVRANGDGNFGGAFSITKFDGSGQLPLSLPGIAVGDAADATTGAHTFLGRPIRLTMS